MILHLVKCEMCNEQFSFNPLERGEMSHAPDSWLTLFHAKNMYAQQGWHFCSKWCLNSWLDAQRTSNEIVQTVQDKDKS